MYYLDACIVIYWVENHSTYAPRIQERITKLGNANFAINHLVIAESLVMPLRQNNTSLIKRFEAFFDSCIVLPMPKEVFLNAAQLRAKFTCLKTPDALHLATAQFYDCKQFWTNDDNLDGIVANFAVNIFKD
jgi:predicted nucleic acid-binding protein